MSPSENIPFKTEQQTLRTHRRLYSHDTTRRTAGALVSALVPAFLRANVLADTCSKGSRALPPAAPTLASGLFPKGSEKESRKPQFPKTYARSPVQVFNVSCYFTRVCVCEESL